jgi:hypothetical protein
MKSAGRAHDHRLCRLGEPNLHISIVKNRVVGFHEYITHDPATPITLNVRTEDAQQVRGAFAFSFEDANIYLLSFHLKT